jgi:hypothetical protein
VGVGPGWTATGRPRDRPTLRPAHRRTPVPRATAAGGQPSHRPPTAHPRSHSNTGPNPGRRTTGPTHIPARRTSRATHIPARRTSRPDAHPGPTHIPSHARIHPCRRCPPAGVPRRLDRRDPARSTLGTPDRVHRSPPGTAHRPSLRILSFHDPYLGTRCRAVPVRATAACPESEILVDEDLGFGTLCSVNRPVLGRSARPGTRVCRRDQRAR